MALCDDHFFDQKRLDTNRRDASKSTGPKTAKGKAAFRPNAFRHGLRARTVIPRGDDQSEFDQLSADLHDACHPQNKLEHLLGGHHVFTTKEAIFITLS